MNPRPPCLLLVEDDPVSAAFLRDAAAALPARVVDAGTLAEAMAEAAATRFDLWLVDANLPDGRGESLLQALRARGVDAVGPVHFGRPVPLPDGSETEARFSVFRWPPSLRLGGLGIFACQHHTRDAVWVPSLQTHANGATRIKRVLVATVDAAGAAAALAGAIDAAARQDGAFHVVATGNGRGEIAFAPRAAIARFAGCAEDALPAEGGAAMVLATTQPRPTGFATGVAVIFEAS